MTIYHMDQTNPIWRIPVYKTGWSNMAKMTSPNRWKGTKIRYFRQDEVRRVCPKGDLIVGAY